MLDGSHVFAAFLFLGIVFVLIDSITDLPMRFNKYTPSFALAVGNAVTAQAASLADSIDAQWHAPAKYWDQSVEETVDASGTYNFIFNSSTDPAGVPYGGYNYCNMPHVRRQEYKVAPKEYQLEYVEVIHRHHKRTPYDSNLASSTRPIDLSRTLTGHSFPGRSQCTTAAIPSCTSMEVQMRLTPIRVTGRLTGHPRTHSRSATRDRVAASPN